MNASCHARVLHDRHANRWICLAPCASLPGEVPFIGTRFLVCSTILAGMIGALSPRPAAAQSQQAATTAEPSDEQAATQASAQETESPASATGDAVDPTDEPLPPTVMFLHSNGSVTVTVDGKEHQLSPSQMNRRLPQLLAGKEHIGIRMEEWKYFERAFGAMKLYQMGIRRITLDSGTARRTLEVPAPRLFQVINSGTPAERQKALDEVEKLFRDGKSWQAMEVVRMTYQTQYDRSRFLPYVRDALQSDSENAWGPAISTISLVGGDESDVPLVLKHADHEDNRIRARIANTLTDLDPQGSNPGVNPAIRKLLDDDSHWVRSSTIQSLSGFATSPDVEAKLIELSRGESRGGSSQADTTIKSALTSRPLIRKPVAERLIELIDSNSRHKRKAIKGLCHKADDEARPLVVDALIDVIDSDVDSHVRSDAITGLGLVGGEQAWKKLQMIAMNPNELESDRKTARYFTPRDLPAPTDDAGNPISPPPVKLPPDLWRQIAQDHDPDARQWAIQRMTKMLQDESSAVPGLGVLIKVHEAKFDRTALVPLVRGWLASEDEQIRIKALIAMGTLDDPAIKVTELASYSNDNSPIVRGVVLSALLGVDPEAKHSETQATIEALLNDENLEVVRAAVKSLWGVPTTPAADAALIDLSHHPALAYDVVYFALSTRPLIRKPVAERLIELGSVSRQNGSRAIWGLSHSPVAEDAREQVLETLMEIVDSDSYYRWDAIYGLGNLGSGKARRLLQQIADDPQEAKDNRRVARKALHKLGQSPTGE